MVIDICSNSISVIFLIFINNPRTCWSLSMLKLQSFVHLQSCNNIFIIWNCWLLGMIQTRIVWSRKHAQVKKPFFINFCWTHVHFWGHWYSNPFCFSLQTSNSCLAGVGVCPEGGVCLGGLPRGVSVQEGVSVWGCLPGGEVYTSPCGQTLMKT